MATGPVVELPEGEGVVDPADVLPPGVVAEPVLAVDAAPPELLVDAAVEDWVTEEFEVMVEGVVAADAAVVVGVLVEEAGKATVMTTVAVDRATPSEATTTPLSVVESGRPANVRIEIEPVTGSRSKKRAGPVAAEAQE